MPDGTPPLVVSTRQKYGALPALLTYAYSDMVEQQWLFLRGHRVKRMRRRPVGAFMGSEFAFEDRASQRWRCFTYTPARRSLWGQTCTSFERYPVNKALGLLQAGRWMEQASTASPRSVLRPQGNALENLSLTIQMHQERTGGHGRIEDGEPSPQVHPPRMDELPVRRGLTERDFDQNSLRTCRQTRISPPLTF